MGPAKRTVKNDSTHVCFPPNCEGLEPAPRSFPGNGGSRSLASLGLTGAGEAFGMDRGWRGARDGRGWRIDRGDRRVSGGRGGFAPKKSAGAVAPARRSLEIEDSVILG